MHSSIPYTLLLRLTYSIELADKTYPNIGNFNQSWGPIA